MYDTSAFEHTRSILQLATILTFNSCQLKLLDLVRVSVDHSLCLPILVCCEDAACQCLSICKHVRSYKLQCCMLGRQFQDKRWQNVIIVPKTHYKNNVMKHWSSPLLMTKITTIKLKTNYVHCCWDYPATFLYVSNLFQPICTIVEESGMIKSEASKIYTYICMNTQYTLIHNSSFK